VFTGQLRDVATPYLGLTTIISLGAGIASIAVTGWQSSIRKSSQAEAQLSGIAQHLKEKEAQLEVLKLSEQTIATSELTPVVDEEVPPQPAQVAEQIIPLTPPTLKPIIVTTPPVKAQVVTPFPTTGSRAVVKFASAQTFLGYARTYAVIEPDPQTTSTVSPEVEQLHSQLEQLMAQMASIQKTLAAAKGTVGPEV